MLAERVFASPRVAVATACSNQSLCRRSLRRRLELETLTHKGLAEQRVVSAAICDLPSPILLRQQCDDDLGLEPEAHQHRVAPIELKPDLGLRGLAGILCKARGDP